MLLNGQPVLFKGVNRVEHDPIHGKTVPYENLVLDLQLMKEHNINMRSLKFDTHEGIFEGDLFLYIHNTQDLDHLISVLKKIKGIDIVKRTSNLED